MKIPFRTLLAGVALAFCAPAFAQGVRIRQPVRFVWRSRPAAPTSWRARRAEARPTPGAPCGRDRGGAGGTSPRRRSRRLARRLHRCSHDQRDRGEPEPVEEPGYDVEKDLIRSAVVASSPNVIVASLALGATTLQEVVEKAKSGTLTTALPGRHDAAPFGRVSFKILAKVPVTHVPYKGGGPALAAAMSGEVELVSVAMPPAVPMISPDDPRHRGHERPARRGAARRPDRAEVGLSRLRRLHLGRAVPPAARAADVVTRLNGEIEKLLQQPTCANASRRSGFERSAARRGSSPVSGRPSCQVARVVRETGATAE